MWLRNAATMRAGSDSPVNAAASVRLGANRSRWGRIGSGWFQDPGRIHRVQCDLCFGGGFAELSQDGGQIGREFGKQAEVTDQHVSTLAEDGEAAAEGIGVEQGGDTRYVEEDAFSTRFDGDDAPTGLSIGVFENRGRIKPGLLHQLHGRTAKNVATDHPGRGDAKTQFGHRDAGIADVSAGREGN